MSHGKLMVMGVAGAALLAGSAWAAWLHWRPAPAPAAPTTVYSWTDAQGVVHFEQQPGRGRAVVVDTRRITPLVTPRRHWADEVSGPAAPPAPPPADNDGARPDGSTIGQQMVDRAVYGDTQ